MTLPESLLCLFPLSVMCCLPLLSLVYLISFKTQFEPPAQGVYSSPLLLVLTQLSIPQPKRTLQGKWEEFQALQLQEQRLLHGDAVDSSGLESLLSGDSLAESSSGLTAAYLNRHNRLSSESSCKSWLSSLTGDSEDGYQTCMSEDSCQEALSRQTSMEDECFFLKDGDTTLRKSSSRRNRNISSASSGSMSPLWEGGGSNVISVFGTLPRKSRRGSVRKQLLKFIPGLHRAVEEEESRF